MMTRYVCETPCGRALAMDAGHCHRVVIPAWRICQRTGYSGWMGIFDFLFPMVNLVVLYLIAFSDWPADKREAQHT